VPGEALVEIRDLHITLDRGPTILDGISFDLRPGRITGLFGNSGCGKSTLALALLGLLPRSRYHVRGRILLRGRDLLQFPEHELAAVRGAGISMVFQDPLLALNPVLRVRTQLAEILRAHGETGDPGALLALSGLPDAGRILDAYPHQLSGGERQRVTIAQALACRPPLIVADEPFSALDAPRAVELIALFRRLRADSGTGFLLISHSRGVLAACADEVYRIRDGRLEGAHD
jgi:ABC-type glutathione transport system ATPase component